MAKKERKVVVFDLWGTLIFGTRDSAISIFYKEITGEDIRPEQLKSCMLIKEEDPRRFLEEFLHVVTPSNHSSMLLSLKNPRSPLYDKIIERFNAAIEKDFREIRLAPGATEVLESLKKRYRLVVLSNLWSYQKKFLYGSLKLKRYFDDCLFSCELGMNKRQILGDLAKLLKTDLSKVIYVGKSYEYDILPAVNAGLSALRIADEDNVIFPEKVERMIDEELQAGPRPKTPARAPRGRGAPRALLVTPPFYKLLGSHNNRINLAASYLSAALSAKGFESKIYHCDSKPHEKYITRYQMVFNSIDFYKTLESEKAFAEFEEFYRDDRSEVVFVTCGDTLNPSFDSGNWDSARGIAKIVRKANPKAFLVAIGPEVGGRSQDFDLIVHGEAEGLLDRIMTRSARGRVRGTLISEEELSEIPIFKLRSVVNKLPPTSLDTVIWRRGCIGTCDFCRVAEINRGRVRCRPIPLVMKEMRLRYEKLGIRNFYVVDANFTSNKNLLGDFCRGIRREFSDVTWRTESRFDTLNEDVLKLMRDSGCTHLKLGLENALHEKHQTRTKRVTLDNARRWIERVQGAGMKCVVYLMLGGKWFTPAQYREMYRNAKSLGADGYTVSLFTPYPNTPSGISWDEWEDRRFTGSHLDIRLIDFWRIPIDIVEAFFSLELKKGREDRLVRSFVD